jgi:hypothetical protein
MNPKTIKNIILSCAVIVLLTCVCVGLILVSGVGVSMLWPFEVGTETDLFPSPEIRPSVEVTETPIQPGATEVSPTEGVTALPDEIADIMSEIEAQVSDLRGLDLVEAVPKILMSPEALEEKVVNDFFAEYTDEDARQDVLILSLLGLLPADFNLKSFYNELYSEQIAGFYDSETEEIYIVSGVAFGGSEKMTYAHEFTHVLQDQNFGFEEGLNYNEEACEIDSERCAAIQALIEGDASLTEILWFQTHATREDYQDFLQMFEDYTSPVLDAAPPYIQADLYFPYEKGFAFVEHLYNQGGFDAVDAAYMDPPLSTEQILHPDRYPWDVPQVVALPDLTEFLGADWVLFDQNVMGEWFTYLILGQSYDETYRLTEDEASRAAEGWGGDAYAFYFNEKSDEVIFILDMVWDTTADADEFIVALTNYADLRWQPADQRISGQATWQELEGTLVLIQDGDRTLWLIAPEDSLAETIFTALQ